MRTYVFTPLERRLIQLYMQGKVRRGGHVNLILKRATKAQVELIKDITLMTQLLDYEGARING